MHKKTYSSFADYKKNLASGEFEEMHLFVPKRSAAKFRAMAMDSKLSPVELFEKMVSSFVYGSFLDKGKTP